MAVIIWRKQIKTVLLRGAIFPYAPVSVSVSLSLSFSLSDINNVLEHFSDLENV